MISECVVVCSVEISLFKFVCREQALQLGRAQDLKRRVGRGDLGNESTPPWGLRTKPVRSPGDKAMLHRIIDRLFICTDKLMQGFLSASATAVNHSLSGAARHRVSARRPFYCEHCMPVTLIIM